MNNFLENEEDSEQLPNKLKAFQRFMTDTEIDMAALVKKHWMKTLKNLIARQRSTWPCDLYYVLYKQAKIVISAPIRTLHSSMKIILLRSTADLTIIQSKVNQQDTIEVCTQKRQNSISN